MTTLVLNIFLFYFTGKLGHTGSVIGFETDLQPLCDVLPRLPKELPILILETPGQKSLDLKVEHEKVKNALIWLKANSEAYKNIQISDENLDVYKAFNDKNIPIHGIRTDTFDNSEFYKVDDEVIHESDAVLETDLNGDIPRASSTVPQMATSKDNMTLTKDAITLAGTKDKELKFNRPKKSGTPVSEFCDLYYSKAFPNLFPTSDGDIRQVLPGPKPSFISWIRHLYSYEDDRFKIDPIFV